MRWFPFLPDEFAVHNLVSVDLASPCLAPIVGSKSPPFPRQRPFQSFKTPSRAGGRLRVSHGPLTAPRPFTHTHTHRRAQCLFFAMSLSSGRGSAPRPRHLAVPRARV